MTALNFPSSPTIGQIYTANGNTWIWDGTSWNAYYLGDNLRNVDLGVTVQEWDADLDAIAALAGTSGLLKKTAADTWTLDTSTYLTSAVTSVSGTAPIVSSGGNTPAISISAATTSAAGSMSATDKAKLDGIAAGATANAGTVTSVTGTAPISVATGTSTPAISISAATTLAAGSMSAADKSKLDGIASGATANVGTVTSVAVTVPTGLSVTGTPITSSGTLAISLTSGYSIPTTASQTNWDTAYTDRNKWDGGSTGLTAATGRTSLGGTTVGQNVFTLTNPSAVTFPRFNADNTVSALDAATFRTAIGAGTSSTTGTVTSASVVSANGFAGTVATASTTPAITLSTTITGLLKGNGTALSAAVAGTDYLAPAAIGVTVQAYDANLPTWPAAVSATEVGYLDGVTSSIQTQLGGKLSLSGGTMTGAITFAGAQTWPTFNQNTSGTAAGLSATLVETSGGTGQSTYAAGDLLYSDATNSLGKLTVGSAGKLLRSTGTAPAWSTTTIPDTFAINTIPYASAANVLSALAPVNSSILTTSSTGVPTWGQLDPTLHMSTEPYKRAVVVATTADLAPASFSAGVLTGQATTVSQSATTTAASTTVTTTSATLKVGATVSVATTAIPANLTVATLASSTTITLNAASLAVTTTATSGTGSTATLTFAAKTYAPFAVGASIVVAGVTPTAYNGTFTVTACTTTTVSYASTATGAQTVAGTATQTISAGTTTPTFTQTIAALSIDGYAVLINDRVLIKDQDSIVENGIYYVSTLGTTSVPWVLTRTVDADSALELAGAIVSVDRGTANAGKLFSTTFAVTNTVNGSNVYWKQLLDINGSSWYGLPTTAVGVNLNLPAKTTNFSTGGIVDFAVNSFGIETIKAAGASTHTRASTVYIAGAPVASTNVTITTPYSLYIATGNSYLGAACTATSFNGITGLASVAPLADGTAAVGTSTLAARQDHVHPNSVATTFTSTTQNSQFNSVGVGTAASAVAGEIRATNNVTAYYSDRRLKNIFGEIPDALGKVERMSGIYFENNELAASFGYTDKSQQVGVIAQQVQAEVPEAVKRAPFDAAFTEDGEEYSVSGDEYLTVQYEKLVPVLLQAIKELNAKVKILEGAAHA